MNILFLTKEFPYPLDSGSRMRSYHIVRRLAEKHNLTLLCFGDGSRDRAKQGVAAVSGAAKFSEYIKTAADKVSRKFRCEFLPHSSVIANDSEAIPLDKKKCSFIKTQNVCVEEIKPPDTAVTTCFALIERITVILFSPLPFALERRKSSLMRCRLKELFKQGAFDIFICDGLHQAVNVPFEDFPSGVRTLLIEHNVESVIVKRYMDSERNIAKKLYAAVEYLKMRRFEFNMWRNFGSCAVCSNVDKEIVRNRAPNLKISVVPNGVDLDSFKEREEEAEPFSMVYTGEMGWFPNEDAVVYFAKKIYPLIKRKAPSAKFYIVGRNPSARVRGLSRLDESIVVTGAVRDVREYVYRAEVFVAPIRIGSGTRLKILEAMAMGKPVVSTSVGCEGLGVEDAENILIADSVGDFAEKTLELFRNKELREKLIQGARKVIEERYDWNVIYKELDELI